MQEMMLPVEFMKVGFGLAIPLVVVYFFTVIVRNQLVKFFLCLVKTAAYFGLAFFMWKFYQGKEMIDIVSAFTFIFCCFEATDNFISMISMPIEYIREWREMKFQHKMQKMELDMKYDRWKDKE